MLSFKTGLISSTVCLDYAYFKVNYRLIAVDLSKQKALDADNKQFNKYYLKELLEELITQNLLLRAFLFVYHFSCDSQS